MYNILYAEEAKKNVGKLGIKKKRQIKDAIERIASEPKIGKALTQELSGLFSYCSGNYRIIYQVYHHRVIILILTVGHRKDVYKKIARKLK